jgi:3-oxoadipate enol-lactonase
MPRANVNGIELYYEESGRGEPLLLIQGFGGRHGWFCQVRAFSKRYRVIIFDNRGIGKTSESGEPYTIRTMASDTVGLMDRLGLETAHILGVSLGGMVAQEVAINYPERVDKLVLASTTAEGGFRAAALKMLEAIGLREGLNGVDLGSLDYDSFLQVMTSLSFNRRLYRLFVVLFSRVATKLGGGRGHARQVAAIMGHNTLDRLHLVQAPTLVITGTEDKVISPFSSDLIASRIPGARLVKVEGGSHTFRIEMSRRFNEEVLAFLSEGQDSD